MIAEDLLREKGIHYELSGKDAKILCLNPEHDDTNPSLRVDRITGVMHCFSCGFKGNLFTHFGAPSSPLEVRLHKLKEKVEKTRSQTVGIQLPKDRLAWKGGGFRNISEETLNIWDAFTWNVPKFEGRIIFPIRDITGKTVALIGRLINGMGSDKYYIYPSEWCRNAILSSKGKTYPEQSYIGRGHIRCSQPLGQGLKNTVFVLAHNK